MMKNFCLEFITVIQINLLNDMSIIAMSNIGQIIVVKEKNINTPLKELKVKVKK